MQRSRAEPRYETPKWLSSSHGAQIQSRGWSGLPHSRHSIRVIVMLGAAYEYTNDATGIGYNRHQPVPFSHKHHVGGLGLDCRYCHTSVEKARFAGMPPTKRA